MLRIFHIFKFCYTLSHFSVLAFYFKYLKQAKQYLLRYFLCQIFSSIAFKFYLPQNTRIHAQFSQVLCQFITLWPFLLCPDTCALFLSKSSSEQPFLFIFLPTVCSQPLSYYQIEIFFIALLFSFWVLIRMALKGPVMVSWLFLTHTSKIFQPVLIISFQSCFPHFQYLLKQNPHILM